MTYFKWIIFYISNHPELIFRGNPAGLLFLSWVICRIREVVLFTNNRLAKGVHVRNMWIPLQMSELFMKQENDA